jgi:hypothetical protein
METLLGRLQVADSSNQYDPFVPGERERPGQCVRASDGRCYSRLPQRPGVPASYVLNPPFEDSEFTQRNRDEDVAYRGTKSGRDAMIHAATIGASDSDIARGQMLLPSASDMPIVRRSVLFDTRFRDPAVTIDATSVQFVLDNPIDSVSRICLQSCRVPLRLDPDNADLQEGDYAVLALNIVPHDRTGVINTQPTFAGAANASQSLSNALAYVPLEPIYVGSAFAGIENDLPPYKWWIDFTRPIPSIERIVLSWWRFAKFSSESNRYLIANKNPSDGFGNPSVGEITDNAWVNLTFYCKTRRPE